MIDKLERFSFIQEINPRGGELLAMKRAGQKLSSEEAAELDGILTFPDNPEAANLLTREDLGKITGWEKEKLKRYFKRRNFSSEVNAFLDRVEAGDPNVVLVSRNEGKAIKVIPGDHEKIIWTYELGCCNSVLVYTEHPDGTRNAVLTHYHPNETPQSLLKLG